MSVVGIPTNGIAIHLLNPRDVVPESNMPGYYWLDRPLKDPVIGAKMAALRMVGVPYTDKEIADAPKALEGKTELEARDCLPAGPGYCPQADSLRADGSSTTCVPS